MENVTGGPFTVSVQGQTYKKLTALANQLSTEFGFDLTLEQTILHLLKKADAPGKPAPVFRAGMFETDGTLFEDSTGKEVKFNGMRD